MTRVIHPLMWLVLAATMTMVMAEPEPKPPTLKEAKEQHEKADKALNAAWAEVKLALPADEFQDLRKQQQEWIAYRDSMALAWLVADRPQDEAEAKQTPGYLSGAAKLSEDRAAWLKALAQPGPDKSMTGKWADSYGGYLDVVEQDGKLHFVIEVVRGPTGHTGGLAGIADWNEHIGWFSDEVRKGTKDDVTNLAFILRGRKLELIGANTFAYHGMRAYFDGHYVKVEPIEEKDRARVLKAARVGGVPEL